MSNTTPLSNADELVDQQYVCMRQLQDLEQTIADASPEELPKLHAKLLALSTGLTEAVTTYAEQFATSQKAIWKAEERERLYQGGEKKFIKMLQEHGMIMGEVNADYLYDTVTIRIPKKTIRKYFDGELSTEDVKES